LEYLEKHHMDRGFFFKTFRVVAVLLIAVFIAAVLIFLRPKPERQTVVESGYLVEVAPAKIDSITMDIETYGTVKPREVLKLIAEVRGQIADIHTSFQEGNFLKKDTRLIAIDSRFYQLETDRRKVQITQANAELHRLEQEVSNLNDSIKIAESDVKLAEAEFKRLAQLKKNRVISQSTSDKSEQKYLLSLEKLQSLENQLKLTRPARQQLKAQYAMSEVLYRMAKLDLEKTEIAAPFTGWVLEKNIESGQHVTIGQTLGRIYRAGELDVEIQVPLSHIKWMAGNGNDLGDADIYLHEGEASPHWTGRISRTLAQVNQETRTLPVIVEVTETATEKKTPANHGLKPGMFVRVNLKGRKINHAVTLPRQLIHENDVVYLFENKKLKQRHVGVLRRFKDTAVINSGLSAGELIIKTPIPAAVDGMALRLAAPISKQSSSSPEG
jgi:RND family efflux transporter MFP subunit